MKGSDFCFLFSYFENLTKTEKEIYRLKISFAPKILISHLDNFAGFSLKGNLQMKNFVHSERFVLSDNFEKVDRKSWK